VTVRVSHLTTGSSAAGAAAYTTASITPTADRPVVVGVVTGGAGIAPTATIAGNGITYAQDTTETRTFNGGYRLTTFTGSNAAPTTGTIVITLAGAQLVAAWTVFELIDTDLPIVQTDADNGVGTTQDLTLSTFADSENGAVAIYGSSVNTAQSWTPTTGWTAIGSDGADGVGRAAFIGSAFIQESALTTAGTVGTFAQSGHIVAWAAEVTAAAVASRSAHAGSYIPQSSHAAGIT